MRSIEERVQNISPFIERRDVGHLCVVAMEYLE